MGILLIGTASDTQTSDALVVVRMLSDGTLDPSFGSGGVLRPAIGSGMNTLGGGAALTSDGKLIVAGSLGRSPYRGFVSRILLSTPVSPPPPAGCSAAITFDAIVCRIDVLGATVDAQVAAGSVHDRLATRLAIARARTLDASTAPAGRARKKAVKKPLRSLAAMTHVLGSKAGRKLGAALRADLKSSVRAVQGDLRALATQGAVTAHVPEMTLRRPTAL